MQYLDTAWENKYIFTISKFGFGVRRKERAKPWLGRVGAERKNLAKPWFGVKVWSLVKGLGRTLVWQVRERNGPNLSLAGSEFIERTWPNPGSEFRERSRPNEPWF